MEGQVRSLCRLISIAAIAALAAPSWQVARGADVVALCSDSDAECQDIRYAVSETPAGPLSPGGEIIPTSYYAQYQPPLGNQSASNDPTLYGHGPGCST